MGWQVQLTWLAASLAVISCVLENTKDVVFGPNKPTVFFMRSHFGNFFMAHNKTIAVNDTGVVVLPTNSTCQCRIQCRAHPQCLAWSDLWLDGVGECRLGLGGPNDHWVTDHDGATYYFKEDAAKGTYRYRDDGLLYLEVDQGKAFFEGREFCDRIPGHRMAIFRTAQQWGFINIDPSSGHDSLHLNLMKTANGNEQRDGTLLDMSLITNLGVDVGSAVDGGSAQPIYVIHDELLKDFDTSKVFKIWCQANPFGVEW